MCDWERPQSTNLLSCRPATGSVPLKDTEDTVRQMEEVAEPDQHPSKVLVHLEDEKPVCEGPTGPFRITLSLMALVTGRNKSNFSSQEGLKLSEVPAMSWEDIVLIPSSLQVSVS